MDIVLNIVKVLVVVYCVALLIYDVRNAINKYKYVYRDEK